MEEITLWENERLDDLLTKQLKIIQSSEVFSFSMDAVLLARFCTVPKRGKIVDLCTGNGVIPLLLSTRTEAEIVAVEIQERLADMALRNVKINDLQKQIQIVHGDLRTFHWKSYENAADLITANPPYLPVHAGEQNENQYFAAARHEIYCNLQDVVSACSRLVRPGGKVAMVHRPSRLAEIVCTMRQYRLEPKRIRFVHPRNGEEANMVLIEALRGGKAEVRLLPPLIIYKSEDEYCDELLEIYYGQSDQLKESGSNI